MGGLPQIMQLINQRENPVQPLVPAMTPQGQDPVACATLVLCQDHIPTTNHPLRELRVTSNPISLSSPPTENFSTRGPFSAMQRRALPGRRSIHFPVLSKR